MQIISGIISSPIHGVGDQVNKWSVFSTFYLEDSDKVTVTGRENNLWSVGQSCTANQNKKVPVAQYHALSCSAVPAIF